MSDPVARTRRDFDRIAQALDAAGAAADSLEPHESELLAHIPAACELVLEVGCGHGALTRAVARRARVVLAIDVSPEMIRVAQARSAGQTNIEYSVADATTTDLPAAAFDVVLTVATLHHLPLAAAVERLATVVRPGGRLVVQDLVARPGLRYLPVNARAWLARRMRGTHRAREVDALYRAHGHGERYLTPDGAERAFAELLPGARVLHHLEWRYTVVWDRPDAA